MTPYHQDDWLTVWQGDCREVMAQMPAESVHTVVTSPPYWGLRDYGTASWLGGDDRCDHREPPSGIRGVGRDRAASGGTFHDSPNVGPSIGVNFRHTCRKCGAVRQDSQLGLEPTPEEYVANMVAVFREVRRVLRSDGTAWVNLGDSYATNGAGAAYGWTNGKTSERDAETIASYKAGALPPGLKPKDLVGIPWRVAFALQADGWYLRSDIIWSKPNPMPESVTDRPTKAHEYLFLLSKSPRYFWDADAVRESAGENTHSRGSGSSPKNESADATTNRPNANWRTATTIVTARNLRSVWSIATQPYPGAHFATFPEKLVEPCVKAGTSEKGVCPGCGAPWRRVVEVEPMVFRHSEREQIKHDAGLVTALHGTLVKPAERTTTGWQPSCRHDRPPIPATVLDPFAGSGTTGRVAQRLGRRAVLIDLSGEYLVQAMNRNTEIPLGLETA